MADGSPRDWKRPALENRRGPRIDVAIGRLLYPGPDGRLRTPATRAECPTVRPCPHVGCRHNNYLEVTEVGTLKKPDYEPWEQPASSSCALDSRGGMTLGEVAKVFGMTSERVRQIENAALAKLRARAAELGLSEEELRSVLSPGPSMPYMKGDF